MYGSVRQWAQLANATSPQAAMRDDVRRLLAAQASHADVLHHNMSDTSLLGLNASGSGLALVPYARYVAGVKAVLVVASK